MKNSFLRSISKRRVVLPLACVAAFILIVLLFDLFNSPDGTEVIQDDGTVMVFGQSIPVDYTPPSLVTGVDVPKMLATHIPDFSSYKPGTPRPGYPGLQFSFTNRPAPTDENGNPIINYPSIKISVGVYRSHRAAVEGLTTYMIAAVPQLDQLSEEDPGFFSWSLSSSTGRIFVRDNVLVIMNIMNAGDVNELIQKIDADLKAGQNGVTRGTEIVPPVIGESTIKDRYKLGKNEIGKASLGVTDPAGRTVYRSMMSISKAKHHWLYDTILKMPSTPVAEWKPDGTVTIRQDWGRGKVELRAVAINDLCVVSDPWEKQVIVQGP